ncbi:hypothetical protein [Streptomyces sp. WZ-12]|uniref:hypothetical protein n=1 Tax=Streptomyces sp. WZ-12 TaxID=3030210 RepID=UPI002381425D|nr:hypothetical protein [Streptomyces sp. WZ-12]
MATNEVSGGSINNAVQIGTLRGQLTVGEVQLHGDVFRNFLRGAQAVRQCLHEWWAQIEQEWTPDRAAEAREIAGEAHRLLDVLGDLALQQDLEAPQEVVNASINVESALRKAVGDLEVLCGAGGAWSVGKPLAYPDALFLDDVLCDYAGTVRMHRGLA